MNSCEKGKEFEERVYEYFKYLVEKKYFGFDSQNIKIHKQYPAYSKDREANIIFDIAIECFTPNELSPFFTIFIECKNYEKNVPVDDIEEFSNKISQVNKHSAKGIVVTKKGFQKSALKISQNRRLALWRIIEDYDHEIILNRAINRSILKDEIITNALIQENYSDILNGSVYIQTPLRKTTFPKDLVYDFLLLSDLNPQKLLNNKQQITRVVPYLSKQALSKIANEIFNASNNPNPIDLDNILENLGYNLINSKEIANSKVIAEVNFKKRTVTVFNEDNLLSEQIRFAKAHEIAHIVLNHDKFLEVETINDNNLIESIKFTNNIHINIDRLEFQANYLASCILMPENSLKIAIYTYTNLNSLKFRGEAPLYIDNQPCNFEHYHKFIIPLAERFKVSQEALKIRLTALKLVKFNINQESQSKKIKKKNLNSWLHII